MKHKHDRSVPISKCSGCAYLAGRRSAFRSIARWARKEAALYRKWRDNTNKDTNRAARDEWERGRYVAATIALVAERRARGAS